MTQAQVVAQIQQFIIANGNQEITANVLRPILESMVSQPNDLIGDVTGLTTTDTTNLVNAINEINAKFQTPGSFTLHTGTNDPNVAPPDTYAITDYYIQTSGGATVALWQYNELEWVNNKAQETKTKSLFIPIQDWTANLEDQIVAYINSISLTVSDELLYLYSLKQIQGATITFQKYVWSWTLGRGVYGTSNNITSEDIFFISNTFNNAPNQIIDLGEIQQNSVESIVNVSGPFNVPYGNSNAFKVLRAGVETYYLYYGTQELIGLNEYQTLPSDFIEVDNSYPSGDISSKLDAGTYVGTAQDLKDEQVAGDTTTLQAAKDYADSLSSSGSSLLSEPFAYTSGAQTFTLANPIAQIYSVLVGNSSLQRTQYSFTGSTVTITDPLIDGAVIEINYTKL